MSVTTPFSGGGPRAEVVITGLPQASAALREAAARGYDMRPAMLEIRELFIEGHRRQWASKGTFLGQPWEANAPGTLARKARKGIPSLMSTMVESGDLQESLAGGQGSRTRVTKSSVSVGTSLFYAIFAIAGTKKGEPARPPIGINQVEADEAINILENFLLGR